MCSPAVAPKAEPGSVPEIESLKRRDDFRRIFQRGTRAGEPSGALALRFVRRPAGPDGPDAGPRFGFQIKKKRERRSPGTA